MPKEEEAKQAPVPFAELKFNNGQNSANNSVHGKPSETRLGGNKNTSLSKMFMERVDEVSTLRVLCKTIKQFIKRNRDALLVKHNESAPVIIEMQKNLYSLRQETDQSFFNAPNIEIGGVTAVQAAT